MSTTPLFGITYPGQGATDYYADLQSFFTGVETAIGQHCHLVLTGNTADGTPNAGDLGFVSSGTAIRNADPSSSRWGRAVLQADMVNATLGVSRIVGISAVTGASGAVGDPIFHGATTNECVLDPADAVVDDTDRIVFLTLGMCLGSGSALFNGTLPLGVCPVVGPGQLYVWEDGSNNPISTGVVTPSDGTYLHWQAQFDGATQDVDVLFPFVVPGDFGSFPDKAGAAFWGFKTRFKRQDFSVTGYAGGMIVAFVDTAGTEFTSLGTAFELANTWTDQVVDWATLNGLGAVMTPGGTCFLRLKLRGNNGDYADFERPVMQYFPAVRWN